MKWTLAIMILFLVGCSDNPFASRNTLYWDDEQFAVEGATRVFMSIRPDHCWVTIKNDEFEVESSYTDSCPEALTEAVNKFQMTTADSANAKSYRNFVDLSDNAKDGDCIGFNEKGEWLIIKDCKPGIYTGEDDAIWIDWDNLSGEMKEFYEKRKPGQHIAFDKDGKMIWAYDSVD